MKVRIYAQRENGDEELGTIVLKDGQLVPEPKILALTNLLSAPLYVYENGKDLHIDPNKDREKFLKAMRRAVRGSYFWAGEVEE